MIAIADGGVYQRATINLDCAIQYRLAVRRYVNCSAPSDDIVGEAKSAQEGRLATWQFDALLIEVHSEPRSISVLSARLFAR